MHWVDGGIPSSIVLPVNQKDTVATITLSTDPNILPLSHYMLFAIVDDIPSGARIINIRSSASSLYNEADGNASENSNH